MNNSKTFIVAATLSTLTHASLLIVPFGGYRTGESPFRSDFVYVRIPESPSEAALPKDRSVSQTSPHIDTVDSERRKESPPPAPPSTKEGRGEDETAPVPSHELLTDPQKGKVFSHYFHAIKARIQRVAERHRKDAVRQRGKIEVDFVLNRAGLIVSMDARPRPIGSQNPYLASRALDIIRDSEPFLRFPPEIHAHSISFNITLVFDGRR